MAKHADIIDLPGRTPEPTEAGPATHDPIAAAVERNAERQAKAYPKIQVAEVTQKDNGTFAVDATVSAPGEARESLFRETFGTGSKEFADVIFAQIINVGKLNGELSAQTANSAIAAFTAAEPDNELEALLAAQMAAVHVNAMNLAARMNPGGNLDQFEKAEKCFTRLTRTFAVQVEAFKKMRAAASQTMRVEHVHIYEGGQAIVGNVNQGGAREKRGR